MGRANLQGIDGFREANRRNRAAYAEGLSKIPGLRLVGEPADADRASANNQYVVVEVSEEYPLSRDELMRRLHAENVLVRRYFWPGCHRMEPYRTLYPEVGKRLPATEAFLEKVLLFPTGTAVSVPTIGRVLALVERWAAGEVPHGL
jgi:dTDP-4-amino-4,6-dideoxygalactose transaminase